MTEKHPTPAAGIVVWKDDQVLLIQRGREPLKGQWSIPGGKIEYGETSRDTALRELKEETGVEAEIIDLIDVVDSFDGGRHFLLVDYVARWVSGQPVASDDAEAAEFVSAEIAKERLSWDKTRMVIDQSWEILSAMKLPKS